MWLFTLPAALPHVLKVQPQAATGTALAVVLDLTVIFVTVHYLTIAVLAFIYVAPTVAAIAWYLGILTRITATTVLAVALRPMLAADQQVAHDTAKVVVV